MLSSEAPYEMFAGKDVLMKGVILNSGSILALSSGWNLYRLVSRVFLAQIPFSVWKSKRLVYLADRWAMGRDTIAAFR